MMQDRKALQAGTSHFLGQNFAKASDIRFRRKMKRGVCLDHLLGISTRMIGGLIMTHGDDDGLICRRALPLLMLFCCPFTESQTIAQKVMAYVNDLAADLNGIQYAGSGSVVEVDDREIGGARGWEWIKKGIPIRVEIGPRDMAERFRFRGQGGISPTGKSPPSNGTNFISKCRRSWKTFQHHLYRARLTFREGKHPQCG
jgi:prolyl-tRNA synthetase